MNIRPFIFTLGLGALICSAAQATTIAVIDSGVDYRHVKITANQWINPGELDGSRGQDDDGNGLADDLYGWNFAENNNLVIDYKYLGTFSDDPYKFFEVQLKMMLGTASMAEVQWLKEKRDDQEFIKELMKFANFVHGTHVAGISVKQSQAKEVAVKLIPTETKPFVEKAQEWARIHKINKDGTSDALAIMMIKGLLGKLAKQQMDMLETIGAYVGAQKARVANGSFGTGYAQAEMIVTQLFTAMVGREPTEEEVYDIANDFLTKLVNEGARFVKAAPDTLFVFAAGNDGSNNDVYITSPANIKDDNSMAVAALLNHSKIAVFSNYGQLVDVAAPGVGIHSSIPGDEFMKMSGTSQAAPYVTNVATRVFDLNPELSPADVKKIIMGTVDKKDFLKNKVKSGGLVNLARAVRAGELSLELPLSKAILRANQEVADEPAAKDAFADARPMEDMWVLPLPGMFSL